MLHGVFEKITGKGGPLLHFVNEWLYCIMLGFIPFHTVYTVLTACL